MLLCQVRQRLPVSVVEMRGTLDGTSLLDGMLSLRDCLAEQPVALVLDLTHVPPFDTPVVNALRQLANDARRWPGADIAVCGASTAIQELLVDFTEIFTDVDQAIGWALRGPAQQRLSLRFTPDPSGPEQCRFLVAQACQQWGLNRISQLAEVIISELATNAILHARTEVEVTVRLTKGELHMAVRDGDPRLLPDAGGGVEADGREYGRGLMIVDVMADSWGCAPTGNGKITWATIAAS